jgi:hypothetical protein
MKGRERERVSSRSRGPSALREIRIQAGTGIPALPQVRCARRQAVLRRLVALGVDRPKADPAVESLPKLCDVATI